MDEIFSFEDIENLIDKISKIRNESHLINIKNIIVKCNPNIPVTKNNNGIFLRFDNLENGTYVKINSFIKKIINNVICNKYSETESHTATTTRNDITCDEYNMKYSNKERNIIKRCNYDKQCETFSSNLFIKKTQTKTEKN